MSIWYERFKEIREKYKLSQTDLAKKMDIQLSQVNRYESGAGSQRLTANLKWKLLSVFTKDDVSYIQHGDNIPDDNSISQSGSGNILAVGNHNTFGHIKDMSEIDKELISLLEHAPTGFKKKIIEKLKEYRDEEF